MSLRSKRYRNTNGLAARNVSNNNSENKSDASSAKRRRIANVERIVSNNGGCVEQFRTALSLYFLQLSDVPNALLIGRARVRPSDAPSWCRALPLPLGLYRSNPVECLCAFVVQRSVPQFPFFQLVTNMGLCCRVVSTTLADGDNDDARTSCFNVDLYLRAPPLTLHLDAHQSRCMENLFRITTFDAAVQVQRPRMEPRAWVCLGVKHYGKLRAAERPSIYADLTPRQREALTWMIDRESVTAPTLVEAFTKRWSREDARIEYNVLSQTFSVCSRNRDIAEMRAMTIRGGVLAMDRGVFGRADVTCALLQRTPPRLRTLLVVHEKSLAFWMYHLDPISSRTQPFRKQSARRAALRRGDWLPSSTDVVIATFESLEFSESSFAALKSVHWHRVIYDYHHVANMWIENDRVALLDADNRWVLAPDTGRASTLHSGERNGKTIAELLLPFMSTEAKRNVMLSSGFGHFVRGACFYWNDAVTGDHDGWFTDGEPTPLLFDVDEHERRAIQALEQRNRTTLRFDIAHDDDDDLSSDTENDERQSQDMETALWQSTMLTQMPQKLLRCPADDVLVESSSTLPSSSGVITRNYTRRRIEQRVRWEAAVRERHGECSICLETPSDAVLTRCRRIRVQSPPETDSDDGDAGDEQDHLFDRSSAEDVSDDNFATENDNDDVTDEDDDDDIGAPHRHLFCFRCLARSFQEQDRRGQSRCCPMCRAVLTSDLSMVRLTIDRSASGTINIQRQALGMRGFINWRAAHPVRSDLEDLDDDALTASLFLLETRAFSETSRARALAAFVRTRTPGSVVVYTHSKLFVDPIQALLSDALGCTRERISVDSYFGSTLGRETPPLASVISQASHWCETWPLNVDTLVFFEPHVLFDADAIDSVKSAFCHVRRATRPVHVFCMAARNTVEEVACDTALSVVSAMPLCRAPKGCIHCSACDDANPPEENEDDENSDDHQYGCDPDYDKLHLETFDSLLYALEERFSGVRRDVHLDVGSLSSSSENITETNDNNERTDDSDDESVNIPHCNRNQTADEEPGYTDSEEEEEESDNVVQDDNDE